MANASIVIATISTIAVLIIVLLGYFYNDRKFKQIQNEINDNVKSVVSQVNQTGFNKYELDVQQNSLLKANTKSIVDLQEKEANDYSKLSQQVKTLKITEAEDMLRLSNDLTGLKTIEDTNNENIYTAISGIQSTLTGVGANLQILQNTVDAMPIDQQVQQLSQINKNIGILQSYNNDNDYTLSQIKDDITNNVQNITDLQKQFNTDLSGYVKNSDLESYKLKATNQFAHLDDLENNYVKQSDLQNEFAKASVTDDLQRQITDHHVTVNSFFAKQSDLNSYVQINDLAHYATTDALSGFANTSELNNYIDRDTYNNDRKITSTYIDNINQTLQNLPTMYGVKNDVDMLTSLVQKNTTDLQTLKAQYDNVISNYVTQADFDSALMSTQQTEIASQSSVQKLQDTVTGLVNTVSQADGTYLKINDASTTYTPLTSYEQLKSQVGNLPDQNMKNNLQSYFNTYYAKPNDIQTVQSKIDNLGNVPATYLTVQAFNAYKASQNMSTLKT